MRRFGAGLLGVPSRAEEPVGLDPAAIDALFVKHAEDEEWMDMEGIAKLVAVRSHMDLAVVFEYMNRLRT